MAAHIGTYGCAAMPIVLDRTGLAIAEKGLRSVDSVAELHPVRGLAME